MKRKYCCHMFYILAILLLMKLMISISLGQATTGINDTSTNWETSTPEEQGMSSVKLNHFKETIKENYEKIYSMVIIKNGFLVDEEYFEFTATTKRNIYSCTKSFVSALIGIAIEEGAINGTDDYVLDYFPEKTFTNIDDRKKNMTLYHLLTMTAGLEWNELQVGYDDQSNSLYGMWDSNDWVQYVLDQKMVDEPGTTFNYNTGASHVMSAIINKTTGMSTLEFAETHLFNSLDIDNYYWPTDPNGFHKGGEGLELTPRSLAKLGQLYLDNGSWKSEQIVSKEWVELSRKNHRPSSASSSYGYGYQWWIHPDRSIFSAWGYAEQRVIVVPEYDLVVVFTCYLPYSEGDIAGDFVDRYIIPAINSSNSSTDISHLFVFITIPILVIFQRNRGIR